jgi:hypothetical protein
MDDVLAELEETVPASLAWLWRIAAVIRYRDPWEALERWLLDPRMMTDEEVREVVSAVIADAVANEPSALARFRAVHGSLEDWARRWLALFEAREGRRPPHTRPLSPHVQDPGSRLTLFAMAAARAADLPAEPPEDFDVGD